MCKLIRKHLNEWYIPGSKVRIFGTIYQESENLYLHWFGFDTGYVLVDARVNVPADSGMTEDEKDLAQKVFDLVILPLIEKKLDKVVFDTTDMYTGLKEWSGDL